MNNFFGKLKNLTKKSKVAFTLAEVLITLGIIGMVAEMTIPTLMNSVQDQTYKVSYKKAYSVLSQALSQATTDYALESVSARYEPNIANNFRTIMSYFKLQTTCYDGVDNSKCWYQTGEEWNSSARGEGYPAISDWVAVDVSGMTWAMVGNGWCSYIFVDTNGFKKPNQIGKDRFLFSLHDSTGNELTGTPITVAPYPDNNYYMCAFNKCATTNDYFGTSWLSGSN